MRSRYVRFSPFGMLDKELLRGAPQSALRLLLYSQLLGAYLGVDLDGGLRREEVSGRGAVEVGRGGHFPNRVFLYLCHSG